jgi:hypothetical protein
MTKTIGKHVATPVSLVKAAPGKTTKVVELSEEFLPLLAQLSEAMIARAEAKSAEDFIKGLLKDAAGMNADKDETLVITVGGIVKAKIGLTVKEVTDESLLKTAFPEAFAATRKDSAFQVVRPA